ncbi:circadian clock protein : Putative circadian clock protein, KaiC OS=Pedosphaera parvula (strain Ellin514) GN=Cflav_PD2769 PE=4 SV=1: KaiC: KaiC [Gemmataceae bacterium]|nr:circadian clock protein : Putative circadian clock protein, KaiC OS=Pedosphaera parvula (strain Ellin514) GN=Cflav_PD2769 PE=4 SV=1: KaiC: KaiC [Gemmataceae bacterium]VTU02657.1 circadian clock protein : Putative circadian clock protein, KaiC OS=Pedosphaera parvula (strain Ellin514) GN=Cflav_PD2769 PE=4 SV=1: KaiC: KaiC [Gemmataceae bacterium]
MDSTGVGGLDQVLAGGLPKNRLYLIEGGAGAGKTTLALQFLLEGVRLKEPALYVVTAEARDEVEQAAASHGWTFDGVEVLELQAPAGDADGDEQYTVFHPSEVQLDEATKVLVEALDRVRPVRVVIDSITGLRLLAQTPARYRQQVLLLKRALARHGATVLLLDDLAEHTRDLQLRSVVHGIISLHRVAPRYGGVRRQLEVAKLRGVDYRGGFHDFAIRRGGLAVFPRIVIDEHHRAFTPDVTPSGLPGLDTMLGGGLTRGTSTVIIGPAGVGKSSLTTRYALAAAERGEHAVVYTFDETYETYLTRSEGLGLDARKHIAGGRLTVHQIDPAEWSAGEFVHNLRTAVEQRNTRLVVIDSLNGYLHALPDKDLLLVQLHELLTYLNQRGVLSLLVMAQHGLLGPALESPADVSYLADSVLLLRYFEAAGTVRQAISVFKKRTGSHERTIREFTLGKNLAVGDALHEFQGVLTGVPHFVGERNALSGEGNARDRK